MGPARWSRSFSTRGAGSTPPCTSPRSCTLATRESTRPSGSAPNCRAFFATDVADQRTTPLAIVRSLRIEATNVLVAAGVPAVERDRYEEQSFPDDIYGIVPKDLGELGDEDLGAALVAWGLGKSGVLRAAAS